MKKVTVLLAGLALAFPLLARADASAVGRAIADAVNKRDVEAVLRVIDVEAVNGLVMKDLGLKDADREALRKGLPRGLRNNLDIGMRAIDDAEGSAKFLRSGMREHKSYALVRLDLNDKGIDYVEYYIGPSGKVEDWYVHSMATLYSTSARLSIATLLKTDSMLYGLFGGRLTSESDVKPFTDLRQNLQAQDYAAAYRTLERFPDSFRKTRQWALMRVTYGGRIDDATHRAALRHLAQGFGKDSDLQFMLIDHYLFQEEFDHALASIGALERAIGGEDAATANLRGNVFIGAKRFPEGAQACRRGMTLERDHKPAYWCLVTVGIASRNGKVAVEGLKAYERAFDMEFDLDKLATIDTYREIARTPEFTAWKKSRR